jgi:microsomal epoxide hydrolase
MHKSLTSVAAAGLAIVLPWMAAAAEKKPWKDSFIQVGDIKIHYIEAGAGERSLVFIPGWTMVAEVWREQLPYFSARGFHVYALDPRSHGQTTKTEGGNTYLQQAADLHAFLRTLKIEHAALVGWSAGVAVLLEYISSPETLQPEKLVLVDGSPCGLKDADCPGGATIQQARSFLLSIQEDRAKMTAQFVKSMFKSRQQEALLKEISDGSLKTPTAAALSLFFDGFTGDRRPALARVGVPTLVVVPDERRLIGESMQSKIARSKLEVVPEAGHALFLEKPQTFNQILESFLGEN